MELLYNPRTLEEVRSPSIQEEEEVRYKVIQSPIGDITLFANSAALTGLNWGSDIPQKIRRATAFHPILEDAEQQLNEYFLGMRRTFHLPLMPNGTEFQRRVWNELLKIPCGETITYGEQAKRMGQPTASRAVGAANGKNPIGIIIPCHRVIGATGALIGFAGGLGIKQRLLDLERKNEE